MKNSKKLKLAFSVLFLLLLVVGTVYILNKSGNKHFIKTSGNVFGTTYHITYECNDSLQKEIEDVLNEVDMTFSMFNKQSLTARLNNGEDVELNKMFTDVFALTQKVSKETEGAFDITVAPLVNAWGFGTTERTQPTMHMVDSIMKYVGYRKVSLKDKHLVKSDKHVQLDFSAIAKGYACDAVAQMLRKHGVDNYMVEIGGELACRGKNQSNQLWTVGVQQPEEDAMGNGGELQAILDLNNRSVATSGNYHNYYYKDGKRYAHTIDPLQGKPVQHSLLSATVLADNCTTADAYATAFMVMGTDKVIHFLNKHKDIQAFLIYSNDKGKLTTWYSPSLKSCIRN